MLPQYLRRSDGSILAAGGERTSVGYPGAGAPYLTEGRYALRIFNSSTQTWTTPGAASDPATPAVLTSPHWRATQARGSQKKHWEAGNAVDLAYGALAGLHARP